MTIQEFLELINFKVTDSGKYEEESYNDCWFYASSIQMMECFAIFDSNTREVREVRLFDFDKAISYDIINPSFASSYSSIDDTAVRRIDLSDNIGEFKDITRRLLGL